MKLFHELFPGVKPDEITDILKKDNLTIPADFRFSQTNIIIGPNGAGKTRFLNALRELYRKTKNTSLLYGYFPDLMSRRPPKPSGRKLRRHTLQQYRDMDGIAFEDFFQEVQAQNEKFLLRILEPDSESEQAANNRTMQMMIDFFKSLTGKSICSSAEDGEDPDLITGFMVRETSGRLLPLEEALDEISPGERMLFYMSIFLALQKEDRRNQVIILDEPESHLHPRALLQFVRLLGEKFPRATIWIATHSLFLLPEYEFENIVYLEDGAVHKRSSKLYQDVITDVLGEGRENVRQFFASYAQWQYYGFIDKCFQNPATVVEANPKDEQVGIFVEALQKRSIRKVLDFGGGSGRLGLSMMEAQVPQWKDVLYDIYDPHPTYKGKAFNIFTKLEDCKEKYDCIVMMNVLHEVEPEDWPTWFETIRNLMAFDGFLLFVEVKALRDGEYPNDKGYMLLGEEELNVLFGKGAVKTDYQVESSIGFYFTREELKHVTDSTVRAAIIHLEERMYRELSQIRNTEKEQRASESDVTSEKLARRGAYARRYAFLTQQYINAKLFNDEQKLRQAYADMEDDDEDDDENGIKKVQPPEPIRHMELIYNR